MDTKIMPVYAVRFVDADIWMLMPEFFRDIEEARQKVAEVLPEQTVAEIKLAGLFSPAYGGFIVRGSDGDYGVSSWNITPDPDCDQESDEVIEDE